MDEKMQNEMKKSKKILGAIFSSLVFGVFFLAMTFSITFFQFTEEEALPMGAYVFLMIIFGLPLLGIIINLILRIKEVLGGEEDEASKY